MTFRSALCLFLFDYSKSMFKLFGMLENFFYISLGITFALILLLVYHFKQRLSAAEKKSETMYEIITNVVQELNVMKSQLHHVNSQLQSQAQAHAQAQTQTHTQYNLQPQLAEVVLNDYEADEEEDEDEDDEDSDFEYESDLDDGEGDGEDNESNSDVSVIKYELIEVADPVFVSEITPVAVEEVMSIAIEDDVSPRSEAERRPLVHPTPEAIKLEEEEQHVNEVTQEQSLKDVSINSNVEIKKMNMTQLKSLAATKFPDVDTSKMKKADIIKLVSEPSI